MFQQIFSRLSVRSESKSTVKSTPIQAAKTLPAASGDREKKRVFLNSAQVTDIRDREIVVLGSSGVKKDQAMTQQLKNGNAMTMNVDGSYIVRDIEGKIIKTCDAMRTTCEFKYNQETGALMVKRFGLWTTPEDARLDDAGTLFFTREGVSIEERLSGLHIQRNLEKGITIQTHHHNNFELVKLANGEIWKRETTKDKETFVIWKQGKLSFKSETYFESSNATALTPNGLEPVRDVSRAEQSWSQGQMTREKFCFKNKMSGKREIRMKLQLGTGALVLKNVTSMVSTFENERVVDTTYELAEAISFKLDIPSMNCSLEDIIKIRNFTAGVNLGLCFESIHGDEYVVFVGTRGLDNRGRAAAAAAEIDEFTADGNACADLVLR